MLPLHSSYKSLVFIYFLNLFFSSCSDKSKNDLEVIIALDESIENSNRFLAQSKGNALMSLNAKLNDVGLMQSAKRWYPKAEKIDSISKDVISFIESIKTEISNQTGNADSEINLSDLYQKLIDYKTKLLQVDSLVTKQFENSILVLTSSVDSVGKNNPQLFKDLFQNKKVKEKAAILNKLKNNILFNAERLINFCNEQMCVLDFWYLTSPIIMQSSTIVKPGDSIEITVGILASERYFNPKIFVYDKRIFPTLNGFAVYKLKASSYPGKYNVPVKIGYINNEKRPTIFEKQIEYTVANIQKQE